MLKTLIKNLTLSKPVNPLNKVVAMNRLIDEIHETFYTEVDRLLAEANISKSEETTKHDLIAKRERLIAMGFVKTKEIEEAEKELNRIRSAEAENKGKAQLIKAINYFSQKYPMYKFITEESVVKICEKYNLIYGTVGSYTGEVPDVNLKHIENFKIHDSDHLYIKERNGRGQGVEFVEYHEFMDQEEEKKSEMLSSAYSRFLSGDSSWRSFISKAPLEIAAPHKDFNLKGMEINKFKLSESKPEVLDPVVLKPVYFNMEKYYLIVTAWGQEATDELVLNPIHN